MSTKRSYVEKVRVTASLDSSLVQAIDAFARTPGGRSRSRLIEEALHYWIAEQKRRDLEEQIEKYYLSLSEAEGEEDREWAEGASRAATEFWG